MWFLPSRITIATAVFFFFFQILELFVPSNVTWLIRAGFFWWIFYRSDAGRSWWSYLKLLVVVPYVSSLLPSMLGNMCLAIFRQFSQPFSRAEACYDLLELPFMLSLSDPWILQKSQYCFNAHNMTSDELGDMNEFFRLFYRESYTYSSDVFVECLRMKKAFRTLDKTPALDGIPPLATKAHAMDWIDPQVELAAQCLRLAGGYDAKTMDAIRQSTETVIADNMGKMQKLSEMTHMLKKLDNVREIKCEDGESEESCRVRRADALADTGLVNRSVPAGKKKTRSKRKKEKYDKKAILADLLDRERALDV